MLCEIAVQSSRFCQLSLVVIMSRVVRVYNESNKYNVLSVDGNTLVDELLRQCAKKWGKLDQMDRYSIFDQQAYPDGDKRACERGI